MKRTKFFHRWFGLFAAFFTVILAITGMYLNHHDLFESNSKSLSNATHIVQHPLNQSTYYIATSKALFKTDNAFKTTRQIHLKYPAKNSVSLIIDPQHPAHHYVALKSGHIFRSTDNGKIWSTYQSPREVYEIKDFKLNRNGSWSLLTKNGIYQSHNHAKTWQKITTLSTHLDLTYFMYRLHTGELFAPLLVYIYDFTGILLICLTVTGLYLFARTYKK